MDTVMMALSGLFLLLSALSLVVSLSAWDYDHKHDYESKEAKKIGMAFALPAMIVFFTLAMIARSFAADESDDEQKEDRVMIQCELNDQWNCEVVG